MFCPHCGNEIKVSKKSNTGLIIALVLESVLLLAAIACIVTIVLVNKNNSNETDSKSYAESEYTKETAEDEEKESEPAEERDIEEESTSSKETEAVVEETGESVSDNDVLYPVDPSNSCSFTQEQITDYTKWNHYSFDLGEYDFYVPNSLFNQSTIYQDPEDGVYGTIVKESHFLAEDGTFLNFMVTERHNGITVPEETEIVCNQEKSYMVNPTVDSYLCSDEQSRIIVTGYTDISEEVIFYSLAKIDAEYIYQMKIYYKQRESDDDELRKAYYEECLYRMCAFSGATEEPRSFEDFKNDYTF